MTAFVLTLSFEIEKLGAGLNSLIRGSNLMTSWLTLQEYSIKKDLSVSTLRRKIKNSELEYRLENGRYLLKANLENPEEETSKKHKKNSISKELKSLKEDKEDLLNLVAFLEEEKKSLEENFITLRNNNKDLLSLVSFLEEEKKELLRQLENLSLAEN